MSLNKKTIEYRANRAWIKLEENFVNIFNNESTTRLDVFITEINISWWNEIKYPPFDLLDFKRFVLNV